MKRIWNRIKALYAPMTPAQAFERLRQELPGETICVEQSYWQNVHGGEATNRIECRVSLFKAGEVKTQKDGADLALVVELALLDYRRT